MFHNKCDTNQTTGWSIQRFLASLVGYYGIVNNTILKMIRLMCSLISHLMSKNSQQLQFKKGRGLHLVQQL